jgi:hypothetical protein
MQQNLRSQNLNSSLRLSVLEKMSTLFPTINKIDSNLFIGYFQSSNVFPRPICRKQYSKLGNDKNCIRGKSKGKNTRTTDPNRLIYDANLTLSLIQKSHEGEEEEVEIIQ